MKGVGYMRVRTGGAYFDVDEDVQALVLDVFIQVEVELLGAVLTDHQGVLGQALEEALRRRALDVEVEALHGDEGGGGEREGGEEGAHSGRLASFRRPFLIVVFGWNVDVSSWCEVKWCRVLQC